jgi:hypothetical protein
LSKALPTVGLAPQPEVVSLSPHLVETQSSAIGHGSRCFSLAHWHVLARRLRGPHDRVVVAVALDAEADHGLAGRGDAVDDLLGPAVLDADDDDRGDVRIAAGADQRPEVELEVGAELEPPVGMRDRQRALDVVGDRLGGGVREVVERQDDDEVADADAAVLAPVAEEGGVLETTDMRGPCYQRLVLMLWTWACSPRRIGATTLPMSMPYLTTGVARRHVLEGDLVADRDVLARLEGDRPVVVHDPAGHRRAGADALDDDHRDGVAGVVQYAMDQSGLLVQSSGHASGPIARP